VKRAILAIVAAIILAPLCFYFGYRLLYPTYTYRYRLALEVETPDGIRSGSSVIEVRYEMFSEFNGRDHVSRVFGEAVFVDLGQRKNLVGLLAAGPSGEDVDYPGRIVFLAFNLVPHHSGSDWLILSQFRMGRWFGATRIWMLLGTPG